LLFFCFEMCAMVQSYRSTCALGPGAAAQALQA